MAEVCVSPMPARYALHPMRYRPAPAPLFAGGDPTDDDRALARELFDLLDEASREWYRHNFPMFREGAAGVFPQEMSRRRDALT